MADIKEQAGMREQAEMRWYVYALAYPDGRIFYVGKGTGDRISWHEQEARGGAPSRKCDIIRDIWASGGQVERVKLAFFKTNEEALAYEASLISSLGGLANTQKGRKGITEILLTQSDASDFGGNLRQWRDDGTTFWSAREVAEFLGYISWAAFEQVIRQAKSVARLERWDEQEHFKPTHKLVRNGLRSHRSINDYQLSREAFWLVVSHADQSKFVVLFGIGVLAMQAAIFDGYPSQDREGRSDDSRNGGYRGLYGGLTEDDIHALKRLAQEEEISNWMGSEELADNIFRAAQTDAALKREKVRGKEKANTTHFTVGRKVREFIINELGGTAPEALPTPQKSIKQLEREEQHRLQHRGQLSLFEPPPEATS